MNFRAKMSSKGQVVVPKPVRDARGWSAGTELEFVEKGNDLVVQPARQIDPRFPPITWEEFEKHRIRIDRLATDEEIDVAMLAEAKRRFDATRR